MINEFKTPSDNCPEHDLPYDTPVICATCHGSGEVEDDDGEYIDCWQCHGSGEGPAECEQCLIDEC